MRFWIVFLIVVLGSFLVIGKVAPQDVEGVKNVEQGPIDVVGDVDEQSNQAGVSSGKNVEKSFVSEDYFKGLLRKEKGASKGCSIEGFSLEKKGNVLYFVIRGSGCEGKVVDLSFFEKDRFWDDIIFLGRSCVFHSGKCVVDYALGEDFFDKEFGFGEGNNLELYFRGSVNGENFRSGVYYLSRDGELGGGFDSQDFVLEKGNYRVVFEENDFGVGLKEIRDLKKGQSFYFNSQNALWKVVLKDSSGFRDVFPDRNFDFLEKENALIFSWKDVRGIDFSFEVSVSDGVFWRVVSAESSQGSLFEVEFPRLDILPKGEKSDDYLFFARGHQGGSLFEDPSSKNIDGSFTYPTEFPFEFFGFDDGSRLGIYFSALDDEGYFKKFDFHSNVFSKDDVLFSLVQIPENSFRAKVYSSPYSFYMRIFDGGWYEGARIYREWAIKQSWVPKKLYERKGFDFFAKNPFVLTLALDKSAVRYVDDYRKALGLENVIVLLLDYSVPLVYNDYPNYFPLKKNFGSVLQGLHSAQSYVLAFVGPNSWNEGVSLKYPSGGVVDFKDTLRYFVYDKDLKPKKVVARVHSSRPIYTLDVGSDFFRKYFDKVFVKGVFAKGFDGAYLDSFWQDVNYGEGFEHPSGGGKYGFDSLKKLYENVFPNLEEGFQIAVETLGEPSLKYPFLRAVLYNDNIVKGEKFVPISHVLYHDYAFVSMDDLMDSALYLRYAENGNCLKSPCNSEEICSKEFFERLSNLAVVYPYSLGSFYRRNEWVGSEKPPFLDYFPSNKDLLRKAVLSSRIARNFTLYGEFLKPLDLKFDYNSIYQKDVGACKYSYVSSLMIPSLGVIPPVFSSVWKSPKGNVGIYFVNYNEKDLPVDFYFDFSTYGMNGKYGLYLRGEKGLVLKGIYSASSRIKLIIPAKSFVLYEFHKFPVLSGFDGATTDFSKVGDITRVKNAVLERKGFGRIDFSGELNFEGLDLSKGVKIEKGRIVNLIKRLNVPAKISFYGFKSDNKSVVLYKDGKICLLGDCKLVSFDMKAGDYSYEVKGFSEYVLNGSDCIDEDKDGYSVNFVGCGAVDCDDSNKEIHPGAKEVCGNGKDDDCDGEVDEGCGGGGGGGGSGRGGNGGNGLRDYCGDKKCSSGENCSNCAKDCGSCETGKKFSFYDVFLENLTNVSSFYLNSSSVLRISFNGTKYNISVSRRGNVFDVLINARLIVFYSNEEKDIDLNGDGVDDLFLKVVSSGGDTRVFVKGLFSLEVTEKKNFFIWIVSSLVAVFIGIIYYLVRKRRLFKGGL